jgi:hypothetical protein
MSAVTGEPTAALNPKQQEILAYLREAAETKTYFKSRLIGDALGLSAKEVGTNMPAVANAAPGLEIEKWGYSSSTTWKVTG